MYQITVSQRMGDCKVPPHVVGGGVHGCGFVYSFNPLSCIEYLLCKVLVSSLRTMNISMETKLWLEAVNCHLSPHLGDKQRGQL